MPTKGYTPGLIFGTACGGVTLLAGLEPIYIATFCAALVTFVSGASLLYALLFGWPLATFQRVDFYSMNRSVISAATAAGFIALLSAATLKVSSSFGLSTELAAVLSSVGLFLYCSLGVYVFSMLRR